MLLLFGLFRLFFALLILLFALFFLCGQVKEIAERVRDMTQHSMDTDVLSLAPKKAAWDLARYFCTQDSHRWTDR